MNNTSELDTTCPERVHMTFNLSVAFLIALIHMAVFVAGFVENICVMIVIVANKSLHTTTNYYLFSLAISDIFCLTCTPLVLRSQVTGVLPYVKLCTSIQNLSLIVTIGGLSIHTSILTVALFTVERYLAICHPFEALQLSSKKQKVVLLIISSWTLSLLVNFPFYWDYFGKLYSSQMKLVMTIVPMLLYLIPFLVITILCFLMVCTIRKKKTAAANTHGGMSTERTNRLLGVVVTTFFIGWIPVIGFIVLFSYLPFVPLYIKIYIYRICCILACMPAVVNPILYNVLSSKFREGFKATFMRRRCTPDQHT